MKENILQLHKSDVTSKYRQVFLFVAGILDKGPEKQRQIGGHGKKGLTAVEVQRYALNCTYTVNLLNGRFGVDKFNILEGPSNGFEMIDFFRRKFTSCRPCGEESSLKCYCINPSPKWRPKIHIGQC